MPLSMDNRTRMICLFDCYGSLMTDKQKSYFNLYFNEDLSLAEIAELMGTSRQAVHKNIARCEKALEDYEEALGMYAREEAMDALLLETSCIIQEALEKGAWDEAQMHEVLMKMKQARKAD